MKRIVIAVLSVFILIPVFSRTTSRIDGKWLTWLTSTSFKEGVPADTLEVSIPHNWDDYYGYRQLTHGNLHGTAVYVKTFKASRLQDGQRAFLRFEGVGTYSTVHLNGKDFGRHPGGRVSFTIDVTDALQADNRLEVICEHPDMICDMPDVCGGCSSEWGFSEGSQPLGIYRPVTLEITESVRVEPFGVHIWHNKQADTLFIETEIKNYGNAVQTVTVHQTCDGLDDGWQEQTVVLAPAEVRTVKEMHPLNQPIFWDPEDPFLYELHTSLTTDENKQIDCVTASFGIRTLSWPLQRNDGDGRFYINGRPFFINGICEYEHILGGSHAFTDAQIRARVKGIMMAGFNAFRDAHQPHNLLYQKLWDENGILLWTQYSAHVWYDTPEFRENFKLQLRQWVKERRNCPSVVLWGLQNESVLPEEFARECCEIIREMDPTSAVMRPITTCNGGTGADWNVVQNWSGTYGGNLEAYGHELSQPSQLLNGEYGAWRTLDMHQEPSDFKAKGDYTEERFTQLLETKIRLAEQARDSVCGQFMWVYTSHDNPGRRQPEEAYRIIDRVGPVNYKGLLTPWEEPVDALYMYQANYVSPELFPMVYIVSHTWPGRFAAGSRENVTVEVYSNCDSVRLYNDIDDVLLGTEINSYIKGSHFVFNDLSVKYNLLYAVGYHEGKPVATDLVRFDSLPASPHTGKLLSVTKKTDPFRPAKKYGYVYRVNCGGDDFTDIFGNLWKQDNLSFSHSWGEDFPGMNPYQASQRVVHDPILNTLNEPLSASFRFGRQRLWYRFPLPDGEYRVELYFVEPWYHADSMRLFDVALNDSVYLHNVDIHAEAGHDRVLKKVIDGVKVQGGELKVSFPEVEAGQAVVSAMAVAASDRRVARKCQSCKSDLDMADEDIDRYINRWSWADADTAVAAKLPASMLPEDKNTRPSVNYPASKGVFQGNTEVRVERKKECVVFMEQDTDCAGPSLSWTFHTGLAQVYALRINYRNLSGHDIKVHLSLTTADNRELKSAEITFGPNDRGWKVLSTTTGGFINAGTYFLSISGVSMEGLQVESLDVQ